MKSTIILVTDQTNNFIYIFFSCKLVNDSDCFDIVYMILNVLDWYIVTNSLLLVEVVYLDLYNSEHILRQ